MRRNPPGRTHAMCNRKGRRNGSVGGSLARIRWPKGREPTALSSPLAHCCENEPTRRSQQMPKARRARAQRLFSFLASLKYKYKIELKKNPQRSGAESWIGGVVWERPSSLLPCRHRREQSFRQLSVQKITIKKRNTCAQCMLHKRHQNATTTGHAT